MNKYFLSLFLGVAMLFSCQKQSLHDEALMQMKSSLETQSISKSEIVSEEIAYKTDNDSLIAIRCKTKDKININGVKTDEFTYIYILSKDNIQFEVFLGGVIDLDGYAHDAIKHTNSSGNTFTGDKLKKLKDNIVVMAAIQAVKTQGRAIEK